MFENDMAGLAYWMLLVAAVQAAMFYVQLRMMSRGIAEARAAAEASTRAAVAAESSVAAMRETARRQLRAYIDVEWDEVYLLAEGERDFKYGFVVIARNGGQTPALSASVTMQSAILALADFNSFDFPEHPDGDPTGLIVIPATGMRTITSRAVAAPRTPEEWQAVQLGRDERGEVRLVCWGIARYHDIFNKPRWTRYCFLYGGEFSSSGFGGAKGKAARCHRHNDTKDAPDLTLPLPPEVDPTLGT